MAFGVEDKREGEALGIFRHRVVPQRRAGVIGQRHRGENAGQFRPGHQTRRRDTMNRIEPVVARAADPLVCGKREGQHGRTTQSEPFQRHDKAARKYEGRRQLHHQRTGRDGLIHPAHVEVLKITQAAVHDFQAVGRGCAAEILGFDQRNLPSLPSGKRSRARAVNAAAHDHQIIGAVKPGRGPRGGTGTDRMLHKGIHVRHRFFKRTH